MNSVLDQIVKANKTGKKMLSVLIDPDKVHDDRLTALITTVNSSKVDMLLIGGSDVKPKRTDQVLEMISPITDLPLILFPGSANQISERADGILFLSLISGRNPNYLIEEHIEAVPLLESAGLEIIPTAYILIENGKPSSVERVSGTKPMRRDQVDLISKTAKAGEYLGMKLIYLEAGSGALDPIPVEIISRVRLRVSVPIIVGGGLRSKNDIQQAFNAGADMVVIGTAIENNPSFLSELG